MDQYHQQEWLYDVIWQVVWLVHIYIYIINATEGLIFAISQWTHFSMRLSHWQINGLFSQSDYAWAVSRLQKMVWKWVNAWDGHTILGWLILYFNRRRGIPKASRIIHGFHGGFRNPTWGDHSSDGVYNLRWMDDLKILRNKHPQFFQHPKQPMLCVAPYWGIPDARDPRPLRQEAPGNIMGSSFIGRSWGNGITV